MGKYKIEPAHDVQIRIPKLVELLEFDHIVPENIVCMRSVGATARAYARIWSLPQIWQKAMGMEPHYVIEVLSQHFDKQTKEEQDKTLIHELMHIPKTFSGALVPHKCFGKNIDCHSVDKHYKKLKEKGWT